ncbi:MAG: hypothetical protein ACM4AI_27015 [Acidobacteriota bacterium]
MSASSFWKLRDGFRNLRYRNPSHTSKTSEPPFGGGPKRRYYRRTSFGLAVARAESERLRALVEIAETRRILPGKTK